MAHMVQNKVERKQHGRILQPFLISLFFFIRKFLGYRQFYHAR